MTYEELLDLGGSQSQGLSQELIDLLSNSKCKFRRILSRKKFRERCVIYQMRCKRGERQMKLSYKHIYHSECITKETCHASLLGNQHHKPADSTLLLPNQPLEPRQHESQPPLVSCLLVSSPCTYSCSSKHVSCLRALCKVR